jgi:carbamoyltransferase
MYILGLNAYHGDSAACIIKDGVIIAATEEERFRRIKHWAGFPSLAIEFCFREAGISIDQLDYITVSRDPKANFAKKIWHVATHPYKIGALLDRFTNNLKIFNLANDFKTHLGVDIETLKHKIVNIEHHHSHIASAFFASPFDEAAILSIDGFGDFSSTMLAFGKGNDIKILDKLTFPHSAGIFYTAFTQFLGFPYYGDEYKVMGLAPYGEPTYFEKLKELVKLKKNGLFELNTNYFTHVSQGVDMSWENGSPFIGPLYSQKLLKYFGQPRKKSEPLTQIHKDLAASVQKTCEEIIFNALNYLQKLTACENVCITGGVAQNSVANGKVTRRTPFKNVYIPSAGHDAGTSMGSAFYHYNANLKKPRLNPIYSAFTGSRYSTKEITGLLDKKKISYEIASTDEEVFDKVSSQLINAGVVGWFQGRAEFGPRALGARSILADPSRPDAKELINSKIKRRESFRPFAPSILEEYVDEYFEVSGSAPFMEKVFPIRPEKRALIPAVTHVDGTGRLHTVSKLYTPKYYALIDTFRRKTGIPLLLNTSFNENEPIVNSPAEALDCFLRTQMDMLVMENVIVKR